jgi:hypothetical protein
MKNEILFNRKTAAPFFDRSTAALQHRNTKLPQRHIVFH